RVKADAEVDLAVPLLVAGRLEHDVAAPAGVPGRRAGRVAAPAAVDLERGRIQERVAAVEAEAAVAADVVGVVGPVQELAVDLAAGAAGGLGTAEVGRGEPALVVPGRLEVVGLGVDGRLAVDQVVHHQGVVEGRPEIGRAHV